jgi:Ca2+-binding EF-hand superfamily protein
LGSVLSKDECLRVFEQMDADRDGKVTLQEYLNWYEKGTQMV